MKSNKKIAIEFLSRIQSTISTLPPLTPEEEFKKYWQFRINGEKVTKLVFEKVKNPYRGNYQLRSTVLIDCPPNIDCGYDKPKGYVFLVNYCGGNSHGWQIMWQPFKEGSLGIVDVYRAIMIGRPYSGEGCCLRGTSNWLWTQDDVPHGFPIGNTADTKLEWCHNLAAVGRTEVDITLID